MPTQKYRGLSHDPIDGRPLFWSAHPDGLPIREGDSPTLIDNDQLALASANLFFRSAILNIPAQLDKYIEIFDWIANGMAVLKSERTVDVPGKPGEWIVWMSWVDVRGFIPKKPSRHEM